MVTIFDVAVVMLALYPAKAWRDVTSGALQLRPLVWVAGEKIMEAWPRAKASMATWRVIAASPTANGEPKVKEVVA